MAWWSLLEHPPLKIFPLKHKNSQKQFTKEEQYPRNDRTLRTGFCGKSLHHSNHRASVAIRNTSGHQAHTCDLLAAEPRKRLPLHPACCSQFWCSLNQAHHSGSAKTVREWVKVTIPFQKANGGESWGLNFQGGIVNHARVDRGSGGDNKKAQHLEGYSAVPFKSERKWCMLGRACNGSCRVGMFKPWHGCWNNNVLESNI